MSAPGPSDAVARLAGTALAPSRAALERCCGSRRWVDAVLAASPFADHAALEAAADAAFGTLDDGDWLEAFAHHPRIGDVSRLRERFARSGDLSEKEQGTAVASATDDVITRLFARNQAYEARHGHIFIVCATGKTAPEMLALLEARIDLDLAHEIENCAVEQQKITHLRLAGL